ncbi:hypothetical protein DPMN_085565 [Dreissena polymorpha]|uniref:Uncharacterized protein n=1 Tax=Dreissena polymorpha TaxID=45954 RepID=A0A9D4BJJ5_DREPO|nr:hypothetical protein DPMN_085565 [Dreissena polymorpha]
MPFNFNSTRFETGVSAFSVRRRALFMMSSTSPGWLIMTRISRGRVLFVLVRLPTRLPRRTEISPLSMLSDLRRNS